MERLTKTSDKGGLAFTFDLDITCDKSEIEKIVKLGKKLKKYEDLEEQGLLVKLPCKVGDTVYDTTLGFSEKCVVKEIEILRDDIDIRLASDVTTGTVSYDDFGKTVFSTKEDAKKKLNF